MSIFSKIITTAMTAFIFVFANCIATETICNNCKTVEDLFLWSGYDCPDQFNPHLVKNGISKKEAIEKGLKSCEENAKQGIRLNQELLAIYYFSEKKEIKKGLYWANSCAKLGSTTGMDILSYAYVHGIGVVQDGDEAFKWLYIGAAAGDEKAIKNLNTLNSQFGFSETTMQQGKKNAQRWMKEHPDIFFNPN